MARKFKDVTPHFFCFSHKLGTFSYWCRRLGNVELHACTANLARRCYLLVHHSQMDLHRTSSGPNFKRSNKSGSFVVFELLVLGLGSSVPLQECCCSAAAVKRAVSYPSRLSTQESYFFLIQVYSSPIQRWRNRGSTASTTNSICL